MADVEIQIVENNVEKIIKASEEAIERALELCGFRAERNAKKNLYANHGVDTGLLRNSITFALDGGKPNIGEYKADKGKNGEQPKTGSYGGAMPKEGDNTRSVMIGTNVEYAPYVELGTSKMNEIPFLKPAIQDHMDEYRQIIKTELSST